MPDEDLELSLERQYGVPYIDLLQFKLDPELLGSFPEQFLRNSKVCPLFRSGNILAVAMVDPHDIVTIDELRRQTGLEIEPMVCKESDLLQVINQFYSTQVETTAEEVLPEPEEIATIEPDEEVGVAELDASPRKLEEMASEAPVVRWVNQMLIRAVRERASDIHIEPSRSGITVRFRIDGVLHPVTSPPKKLELGVVSRIKIMSRMNIAEKRVPQDGRYGAIIDGREIDFRVSTFPTTYGETVVMRILDRVRLLSLSDLGFSKQDFEKTKSMIAKPHGVIIVSGPTGSGKTTTLYAILNEIRGTEKNIITIEDPVEYDIDNISQSQVNLRAGYTYLVGLRHILRQDPDVIMIGEVRDGETAGVAIRAALTGQLVFTSLHANDAPGTITRLIDMGVEPFLVASAVEGAIAQRLVRRICQRCKEPYHPPAKLLDELGLSSDIQFFKGRGCDRCRNTGYSGRIGIFEILKNTDKIRDLIITRPTTSALRQLARQEGMHTLWEDGLQKVIAGITTLDELMKEAEKI
ncbi:MAG: GspE/PulE family protein [candidate division WOR-3 bacterium]